MANAKRILGAASVAAAIIGVLYVAFAYVRDGLNPMAWPMDVREAQTMISLLVGGFVFTLVFTTLKGWMR